MVAIILGPSEALPVLSLFNSQLDPAVKELGQEVEKHDVVSAMGIMKYASVAICCGSDLPRGALHLEETWLPQIAKFRRDLTESESRHMALAALACRKLELVPSFIRGGALPKRFRPGETFQFNAHGFVRYLAVAMLAHAKAEDIEPAWYDFLQCFPRKLASETLNWIDLLWVARTVMVHFEHRPVAVVADGLRQLVMSLDE